MHKLINDDNLNVRFHRKANLIFSDYVYESDNFSFIEYYWEHLSIGGVFVLMTDWHTIFELGTYMKSLPDSRFINHCVWKNEWGNHPKDRFHQCFDDIVIFSKGKHEKFYSERIQVPKATAKTRLNPSGRETKTATAWIDDICLTTTSKERVKGKDGHLIRWQKPLKLFDRIILPFTDDDDLIVDTHAGSGSLGEWCIRNNRNYVGIELNTEVYDIAYNRLKNVEKEINL